MKIQDLKKERLNLLLLKNTIVMLIPSVIVFGIIFTVLRQYPVVYQMTCHRVDTIAEMYEWYQKDCYNVRFQIPQMKYTGYDYYEDGKRTGAYYYTFVENECMFFLMKTKEPEPVLEEVVVQGRLLTDSISLVAMKNEFAKELGLDYDSFEAFAYPLLLSEIDYPYLENFLIWLGLVLPFIVSIMVILLSVVWTIIPDQHPSIRKLSEFGDRKLVYQEVKSQCKNRLVQHNANYYVTDEYLIISNPATIDFVRIDYIRYISGHVVAKRNGRQFYRLTMSNPEKMFYERDFRSEACADEIMSVLMRLNPQIDNRTMKIFDEAEKKIQAETEIETKAEAEAKTEVETKTEAEAKTEAEVKTEVEPEARAETEVITETGDQ